MEDCRLGNRIVLDVACNWKFVHENLMDFYHVGVLHAKTFGAKFAWTDDNVHLKPRGGLSIFYAAGPPTPGAEPLLGKMPWLEDRPVSFACTGFLAPNCTLFGRIDCVRVMVAWPEGPGRSRTVIYHLFPEAFFDRPGFAETLAVYRDYQIQVLEEDRSMIESMQLAMASPAYRPGRMSTLEKPLHHYLNGYLDRVLGEGAARRRPARSATLTKENCMTRLARFLTLAAVAALIAGLLLPPAAHAQKAFKMGAIVPVSGPAAAFGLGVQRGMELAAEDVGTMTVGADKYKIEVAAYDTVYDPGKTVAAMNRAVYNDGVKYGIIIGAGVHPPILPIIRETGFLDLAFAAAGRQITNSENPTVFRIMASSDQLYQTYLVSVVEKIGAKRVAFLGPNDELGKNDGKLVKAQVETMKGKGVQFVAEEYYERGAKDFGPALLRHRPQARSDRDGRVPHGVDRPHRQASARAGLRGLLPELDGRARGQGHLGHRGQGGRQHHRPAHLGQAPDGAVFPARRAPSEEVRGGGAGTMWERTPTPLGRDVVQRRTFDPRRSRRACPVQISPAPLRGGVVGRREGVRRQAPDRPPHPAAT